MKLPPFALLQEMYNLEEIAVIGKWITPQPMREEPVIHDRAERPGTWDPADILRAHRIF